MSSPPDRPAPQIPRQQRSDGSSHPNKPAYDPCHDLRQVVQQCFKDSKQPLVDCWDQIDAYHECEAKRLLAAQEFIDSQSPEIPNF